MKLKIGVLFLVATIAFAGFSGSYAFTFSDYEVKDVVNELFTKYCSDAEPDMGIACYKTTDPGPHYLNGGKLYPNKYPQIPVEEKGTADPQYGPGCNSVMKNVASTNMKPVGEPIDSQCVQHVFYHEILITMNNTYPWYSPSVSFIIGNCWTGFAVYVDQLNFDWQPSSSPIRKFLKIHSWKIQVYPGNVDFRVNPPEKEYTGVNWQSFNDQLSKINLEKCHYLVIWLDFHFEQSSDGETMPMNAKASFGWEIIWKQSPITTTSNSFT